MQIKKKYKVDLSINFGKQMYAKLKIVKTNKHKQFIMLQDMSEGKKNQVMFMCDKTKIICIRNLSKCL